MDIGQNKQHTEWNLEVDKSTSKVAIWDGWVTGDAAGFTHHCPVRIATENTVW